MVDDGSTDDTGEVIAPYLDRISFKKTAHRGPSAARNRAIRESSGEYLAFLDADDIWHPDKLGRQMQVFQSIRNCGLVHTDAAYIRAGNSNGDRTWFNTRKRLETGQAFSGLLNDCFIIVSSVVVKRSCLEKAGWFDESLMWWEGYDLWLRIAFNHQIGMVNAPLIFRRIHGRNWFYSSPIDEVTSLIAVMKKWANGNPRLTGTDRNTVNQRLKTEYGRLSLYASAQGRDRRARQALQESFSRGFSLTGIACAGLSVLPPAALQKVLGALRTQGRCA
jgi:glycosyltransferase involved in cell wall biosynthesis